MDPSLYPDATILDSGWYANTVTVAGASEVGALWAPGVNPSLKRLIISPVLMSHTRISSKAAVNALPMDLDD